jgi:dTDP-4-dehydrorhamnose reductase
MRSSFQNWLSHKIMSIYDRILVTGAGGMLAKAVIHAVKARGLEHVAVDHAALDITDENSVNAAFEKYRPTLTINCAAYTKVDQAEVEPELAMKVNGRGPLLLAVATSDFHSKLVHYSTDFVFNGSGNRPYLESDPTNTLVPLSEYGRSKLGGEIEVQDQAPVQHLIIRTAWLYGPGGPCFPQTMINAAKAGKPLKVVDDQVGSPTFTFDLAEATLNLIDHNARGIYHIVNSGQTNWHDFTAAILEEFGLQAELSRTTSAEWKALRPKSAIRPAYSVLDTSAYTQLTGKSMRSWRDALSSYRQLG